MRPVRHEKAAALMKMGVEFRRQGEHAEALRRFQLAHELAPSGQTMVQVGLAEQSLQRWVAAEEHLSRGLLQSDAWVAKFRNVIDAALTTVRGHIGVLEITGPAGALVSVAGVSKGTLPIDEIRVNEGSTIVVIADHGSPPWSRVVTVRGGTRTTVMCARPSWRAPRERQRQYVRIRKWRKRVPSPPTSAGVTSWAEDWWVPVSSPWGSGHMPFGKTIRPLQDGWASALARRRSWEDCWCCFRATQVAGTRWLLA